MRARTPNLSRKDWELCCAYLEELKQTRLSPYEPWEFELEAWAANANRVPRGSTVAKLRIRFSNRP
jgi:hypothetical protein